MLEAMMDGRSIWRRVSFPSPFGKARESGISPLPLRARESSVAISSPSGNGGFRLSYLCHTPNTTITLLAITEHLCYYTIKDKQENIRDGSSPNKTNISQAQGVIRLETNPTQGPCLKNGIRFVKKNCLRNDQRIASQ